ncbi:hypothetical protein D9Q98_007541 [Chlorella vulgaris]|uniref:Uncharacterized protein n=1 Tax=Chlorella vulgaris TaxID=3077 RepID=A0A9D4TLH6_CHLVU|nr:hypothetical protein D9Q98_007541 [Chlorella vulgaris]
MAVAVLRQVRGVPAARLRQPAVSHSYPAAIRRVPKPGQRRATPITVAAAAAGVVCTSAAASPSPSSSSQPSSLERFADFATMLFPVWALISGCTAFFHPAALNWITTQQFEWGVGVLMLAMGLSLTKEDFRKCASNPTPILLGFLCQYTILPFLAVVISRLMNLPPAFATGLILLGCCPGGQASNVATFVAHGDVALSVLMTAASTVAATVMTPTLTSLLAGAYIPVDGMALFMSTVQLVLLPTVLGLLLNEWFKKQVDVIRPLMPLLALALTVVLCAVPVAQVADVLRASGLSACVPVILLHSCGYMLGYMLPRTLGFNEKTARTVSIETGMQSAAMGYALSTKHFADVLVAVPSSVSIVFMVWIGAALAVVWRMMPIKDSIPSAGQGAAQKPA